MSNHQAERIEPQLQSARPLPWAVFVFFLALYTLITPKAEWAYFTDNEYMFWVCQSIVEDGDINLLNQGLKHAWANKSDTSRASHIIQASQYPLLPSLVGIPFYVAGKWVARLVGRPLEDNDLFAAAQVSGAFISALVCLLLFQFIRVMGFSPKTAFFATCCFGMGAIVFYQASYLDTEPTNMLALLGTVYTAYLYKTKGRYRWVYFCGLFSGVAAASRDVSILIVPPVLVYLLATAWEKAKDAPLKSKLVGGLRQLFIFLLAIFPFLVLNAWYTFARYGLPYNIGYTGLGGNVARFFSNPLFIGLYGFLFSPGQSLFLSSPVLVLGFFSIKSFYSKYKAESILIFSIFLIHLLVYAKISFWHAGGSFGPRYLLPTIPLLILPMAPFLETLPKRSFLIKVFVLLIFCFGVTIETAQFWGSRSPRWQAEVQFAEDVESGKGTELTQYLPEAYPLLWTGPADMTWLNQFYFVSKRRGYIGASILLILLATIVSAGAYLVKKLRLLPDSTDLRSFAARVGGGIRSVVPVFFPPKRMAYTVAILLVLASAAYASFKYVLVPLKQYNSRPFGTIESPVTDVKSPTLTGKIEVTGWTLDRAGIRAVEIYIDEVKVADAKYGEPSPEVADLFPHIPNSARARFVATGIDTASFSNGIHILLVKALSHKGVWADTEALAAIFVNDPHYDFWSHLNEATPDTILVDTMLTINHKSRRVLLQPTGSKVTFENIPVYEGARLKLGIGIRPEGTPKDRGAIVLEVVANANIPLFSTRIAPQADLAEQPWHDDLIDLRQFSNQAIALTLTAKTESGDETPSIWIGWSDMDIVYPDEEKNPESPM